MEDLRAYSSGSGTRTSLPAPVKCTPMDTGQVCDSAFAAIQNGAALRYFDTVAEKS